jgi:hypothetical protein
VLYTFEFVGVNGKVAHFDLGAFPDDLEARSFATTALADHASAVRVDVWIGDRQVCCINRPSRPFLRRGRSRGLGLAPGL